MLLRGEKGERREKGRESSLFPNLTLLSSGLLLGLGCDGWKKALLLFGRGNVEPNQTSGRLRGLASCRVVRGLVVGVAVARGDLVTAPAAGLDVRQLVRPTADGFRTWDGDCSSLFEPDICPELWRSASTSDKAGKQGCAPLWDTVEICEGEVLEWHDVSSQDFGLPLVDSPVAAGATERKHGPSGLTAPAMWVCGHKINKEGTLCITDIDHR